MLDHLRCVCGHLRMLHGGRTDTECRLCARVWGPTGNNACYRFRWWVFSRLSKVGQRAGWQGPLEGSRGPRRV